ncbi:hypothetical protein Ciccas_009098 [Cichlidogyrus casuarinus]|uniref:Carbonic anhydrase n=1 Tax=Cichlidogyrus casuarinus TaxID=1844966 RepID=A0ABD2PZG6_9PLAT
MAVNFDYGSKNVLGPHAWCKFCPEAGGEKQSPINIIYSKCSTDTSLSSLKITTKSSSKMTLIRKAHNFQVSAPGAAELQGGPLQGRYTLAQFHFHWDESSNNGSEHLINGKAFCSELHLVFVNSKYADFAAALKQPDGLAVVGILLHTASSDMAGLTQLAEVLAKSAPNAECAMPNDYDLNSLLPGNLQNYFTYSGSLTTPPCTECVTWLVLSTAVPITEKTLDVMRNTHANCKDCNTCSNARPVCPLGARCIKSSFQLS